jgi:hypothetical protein
VDPVLGIIFVVVAYLIVPLALVLIGLRSLRREPPKDLREDWPPE